MGWVRTGAVPKKQRFSVIVDSSTHPDLAQYLFSLEYRQGNRAVIAMLDEGLQSLIAQGKISLKNPATSQPD